MDVQGILGIDPEVRNGFDGVKVHFDIDADASPEDIEALVAQSQKRSAVFDIITQPDEHHRRGQLNLEGPDLTRRTRTTSPPSSSAAATAGWR